MMPRSLLCLLVLAPLVLGGCGGSPFSGDAKLPDGYKRFTGAGVSFAYPGSWQVQQARHPDGGPFVQIVPPDRTKSPYGIVQLSVTPKAGGRFDSLADQRRVVVKQVNGGRIDSDEQVDIPGAKKALRAKVTTPPGKGTDPVGVKADSLDVLRDNDDVVVLTAAAPQRGTPDLDPAAVVESFRLAGS